MKSRMTRTGRCVRDNLLKAVNSLASVHAGCLTPFLRRGGVDRINGLISLGVIALIAAVTDSREMVAFLVAWMAVVILQRGDSGRSCFGGGFWITDEFCKVLLEPIICLVAAALLSQTSAVLAGFVLLGCVSLPVQCGVAFLNGLVTRERKEQFDGMVNESDVTDVRGLRRTRSVVLVDA